MRQTVFLDYTQEELDRAYDQRVWAPNALDVIAGYATASASVKARYPHQTHAYGPDSDEVLDLFAPVAGGGGPAPVHVFVHGGAWRQMTKDESAFPAPTFVENGAYFAALNFSVIPKVRLPEMVAQCRRAIAWLHGNAARLGIDPARIHLSGHSSGGHIAGVLLTTDWAGLGLPPAPIRTGICASGMYDLAPVMLSARSSYVKISKDEEHALSAMRNLDKVSCPIAVAFGAKETPEFQRHARDFAAALKATSRHRSSLTEVPGVNHFELINSLARADGALGKIALEQIAGGKAT